MSFWKLQCFHAVTIVISVLFCDATVVEQIVTKDRKTPEDHERGQDDMTCHITGD
jgi:hypothetical protein